MNKYEVAILFHPDLEIDLEKPIKSVEQLIKAAGGVIEDVNNWGKRKLAYPIKNQEFAVYVFFVAELPSDGPAQLDAKLNLADEVIRHLLVRQVEIAEEPIEEEKTDAAAEKKAAKPAKKTAKPAKKSSKTAAKPAADKTDETK